MSSAIDDASQIHAIEELLPSEFGKIASYEEIVSGRAPTRKYKFATESGARLFAKVKEGRLDKREKHVLAYIAELATLGLPLASAIAYGDTQEGEYSVSIYPLLQAPSRLYAGQPIPWSMIEEAGKSLRAFHEATLVGCNSRELLAGQIERDYQWLVNQGVAGAEIHNSVIRSLRYLNNSGYRDACLVHGDLHGGNIMCDGNRLVLCDFDSSYLSDPLLDLAILRKQSDPDVFTMILNGYGDIEPMPDEEFIGSLDVAVRLREMKGAVEIGRIDLISTVI